MGINDAAFERVCGIECGDGEDTLALNDDGLIREFFAGGNMSRRSLPNEQTFDLEGLIGRMRSSSYAPLESDANYAPMMTALEELFRANQNEGRVRMEYSTHVYYGRLGASQ